MKHPSDHSKRRRSRSWAVPLATAALLLGLAQGWPLIDSQGSGQAQAANPRRETVSVTVNQSRVINLRTEAARVSVANPEIADILVIDPRQVYVVGKQLGTTNVVLWDGNDKVRGTINIEVTPDLELLKSRMHDVMPGERVQVRSAQGTIVVSGTVSSPEKADAAVKLAQSFADAAGGDKAKVLNTIQVGGSQQVMLEVKVAEINREFVKRLDVNFTALYSGGSIRIGNVGKGASFPDYLTPGGLKVTPPGFATESGWGPAISEFAPSEARIANKGMFLSSVSGNFLFDLVIDAAKDKGLAKILAEPNLTTLSGQEAQFLAGGEFAVPVAQDDGGTSIEYKEYGVGLRFVPVVLDSGVISLKVNVTVSDLTNQNAVVLTTPGATNTVNVIPSLTKRQASSTVEVRTGETIAIAGLINDTLRENVGKFPGLGDLPVVGMLFRSQEFIKNQTELMIFVTPRLARSFDPKLVRLPTDSFVEPTDLEFYLMGRTEGRKHQGRTGHSTGGGVGPDQSGSEGAFGHDL